MTENVKKVAIVWRGDRETRIAATNTNSRYHRIFEELEAAGFAPEPAVFDEAFADEVLQQLLGVDAVLVWVNPLDNGKTRNVLDPLLRNVAEAGVFVSAHPDVILKMGVKEVLYETRHLGWGVHTLIYRSVEEFRDEFPASLASGGPRVLKRNRGNGGQGVWKVELDDEKPDGGPLLRALEAKAWSVPETVELKAFMSTCDEYFEDGGSIVDQPFQERLPEGMIRCYMCGDKVVGYGHQMIKALVTPPPGSGPDALQPGPRIMHPASSAAFEPLRAKIEKEWTPQMMSVLGIGRESLPVIWDADFLFGPRDSFDDDTYVLCEINVSCVFAIPADAPVGIANEVRWKICRPAK
jgi:glutathione synthase/RimK-type ligase-like ATP-grasp enzyme